MKTGPLLLLAAVSLFGRQPSLLAHDSGGGSSGNSGGHSEGGSGHSGGGSSSSGHSGFVGHNGGGNGNWHGSTSWHNGGGGSHGGDWHGGHSHGHDGDHGRHFRGGVYFDGGYPYGDWDYDYGYGGGSTYYFPPGPSYTQAYQAQAAGSLAAEVQEGLTAAGFYRGPIDGEIGPTTRKAIGRYQSSHHLPVTRRIDEPLLKSLRIL